MNRKSLRIFALLVLLLYAAKSAPAETLLVTSPSAEICVTSADAKFQYSWGSLRAEAGLFSFAPVGEAVLAPIIAGPQEAVPGDLLSIEVMEPEPLDSVTAQILGPKQQLLSRAIGFRPSPTTQKERWTILIGVSALTAPGSSTLSISLTSGEKSVLSLASLPIRDRKFRFERIPLTASLEELRTEEDPRKIAESRELAKVITTTHADAVFETQIMHNPLPQARRTSGYGDRRKYVYPDNSADFSVHEGLDLAAPEGTPVPACGRGRVAFAGPRILTGNTIVIEHLPGLFSLYFHLSQVLVKQGDVVEPGQVIGKVGQTGFATGPHLHWEITEMGVAVDPDAVVARPILDKSLESGETGRGKASKGGE